MKLHRTPGQHAARLWKAFFTQLGKFTLTDVHPTERYVAVFGESFNLAKSEYQLGNRRVTL